MRYIYNSLLILFVCRPVFVHRILYMSCLLATCLALSCGVRYVVGEKCFGELSFGELSFRAITWICTVVVFMG
jgi:hypothetical protein